MYPKYLLKLTGKCVDSFAVKYNLFTQSIQDIMKEKRSGKAIMLVN